MRTCLEFENWQGICGPCCDAETNKRRLRLSKSATFNNFVFANTFGHYKASRRWTWHSPNGQHNNQSDYILVRKHFRSGVNIARTRSFPGADIGTDLDLLMMTFHLRLKRISMPKHTRLKLDLEKLKDTNVFEIFQAMIGGYVDVNPMITTFNTAVTETASEILDKRRQKRNLRSP